MFKLIANQGVPKAWGTPVKAAGEIEFDEFSASPSGAQPYSPDYDSPPRNFTKALPVVSALREYVVAPATADDGTESGNVSRAEFTAIPAGLPAPRIQVSERATRILSVGDGTQTSVDGVRVNLSDSNHPIFCGMVGHPAPADGEDQNQDYMGHLSTLASQHRLTRIALTEVPPDIFTEDGSGSVSYNSNAARARGFSVFTCNPNSGEPDRLVVDLIIAMTWLQETSVAIEFFHVRQLSNSTIETLLGTDIDIPEQIARIGIDQQTIDNLAKLFAEIQHAASPETKSGPAAARRVSSRGASTTYFGSVGSPIFAEFLALAAMFYRQLPFLNASQSARTDLSVSECQDIITEFYNGRSSAFCVDADADLKQGDWFAAAYRLAKYVRLMQSQQFHEASSPDRKPIPSTRRAEGSGELAAGSEELAAGGDEGLEWVDEIDAASGRVAQGTHRGARVAPHIGDPRGTQGRRESRYSATDFPALGSVSRGDYSDGSSPGPSGPIAKRLVFQTPAAGAPSRALRTNVARTIRVATQIITAQKLVEWQDIVNFNFHHDYTLKIPASQAIEIAARFINTVAMTALGRSGGAPQVLSASQKQRLSGELKSLAADRDPKTQFQISLLRKMVMQLNESSSGAPAEERILSFVAGYNILQRLTDDVDPKSMEAQFQGEIERIQPQFES